MDPVGRTTTTTTTPTTTTTTTTTTTITTPTTTTTPAVGCIDVHGSCRAAFGGVGSCIDVRSGNLTDIDPEVTPLADRCGAGPEKCCQCFKMKTTECCKTMHLAEDNVASRALVFEQTSTQNNRPVYKFVHNGKDELCTHYGEQWMITTCEAFYKNKTDNSRDLMLLSEANVDCPHQVEVGDWYDAERPDHENISGLSFSCGSKYTECCNDLRYDEGVFKSYRKTFNNRPYYSDEKREYCMYYFRKQWIVRYCNTFVDDWKNSGKGVVLLSKVNVDCPNQIVGDKFWYTLDGRPTKDVSFNCTAPPNGY